MLRRNRLGRDIFMRGVKGKITSIYNTKYSLTLYELLKTYSSLTMKKDFQRMNIPKLPVLTVEDGIKRIKDYFGKLDEWKNKELNRLLMEKFNFEKGQELEEEKEELEENVLEIGQ